MTPARPPRYCPHKRPPATFFAQLVALHTHELHYDAQYHLETDNDLMLDINHLELSSPTTGEVEIIRAMIMGIDRLLRGSTMAKLVAEPIEHIHRSLDRIEKADRPASERRRPGRTEYLSPELIALSRQPGL